MVVMGTSKKRKEAASTQTCTLKKLQNMTHNNVAHDSQTRVACSVLVMYHLPGCCLHVTFFFLLSFFAVKQF